MRINDPGVSRQHAEFAVAMTREGALRLNVRDLGSTNGITVDGHRVTNVAVGDGSQVTIGKTTMTVVVTESGALDPSGQATPMSELTLLLIRFAYLAILWIFVLSAISVIRSDMFGARVPEAARGAAGPAPRKPARAAKPGRRRGAPTHVLVVEGGNAGERAQLDEAPLLIGRGNDAAIRLDDDYVSTRHARIAASGDQWFVEASARPTAPTSARAASPSRPPSRSAPRSASARRSSSSGNSVA